MKECHPLSFLHWNYHISYQGQCENTFIKNICWLLNATNIAKVFRTSACFRITDDTHGVLNAKCRHNFSIVQSLKRFWEEYLYIYMTMYCKILYIWRSRLLQLSVIPEKNSIFVYRIRNFNADETSAYKEFRSHKGGKSHIRINQYNNRYAKFRQKMHTQDCLLLLMGGKTYGTCS